MRRHEGRPCPHMEGLLHRAADNRLRGFAKWYALAHAARCPQCGKFLRGLETIILSLRRRRDEEVDSAALARLAKVAMENHPSA